MLKITDLKGAKDALPGKIKQDECNNGLGRPDGWNNWRREGFNDAIDQLNHLLIDIDTEELAKDILENYLIFKMPLTTIEAMNLAKSLKSTAHKWLKLRKE